MVPSDWTNALASALLDAEADIRAALRPTEPVTGWPYAGRPPHATPHSVKTPAAGRATPTITMAQHEARTLLRAAMPQPIGGSPLRGAHARMLAAVSIYSAHLLTLNDPLTAADPRDAIAAGLALLQDLRAWLDATRWHQACHRSGTRWPRKDPAQSAVRPLLRHQTSANHEHEVNAAKRQHPLTTMAAEAETASFEPKSARQRRKIRESASPAALQDARDLAAETTTAAETPAEALARMQATAAAIAQAAAPPPRPPATVEQLRTEATTKPPIATTAARRRKAYAA